ncbi:MAG: hypothetical protein WEB78_11750 [Ilumatobacteraceae bacterium]
MTITAATVLPDVTGLDKTFDYLVPDALAAQVRVGSLVRITLAGRRVGGWVVRLGAPSPDVAVSKLVPIAAWSGHGPDASTIDLARWAATRWGTDRLRPFLVTAGPHTRVRAIGASVRRSAGPLPGVGAGVRRLIDDGGGVVRISPTDDVLPVVLALAERGTSLVIHPGHDARMLLAAQLRAVGLTVAVVPDDWALAAAGTDVVLGGRAAAWAPAPQLAGVMVIDEHDESLQEERTPTWHARDVAIERSARAGVPCVLVSPCPTVTALAWSGARWMRPSVADERSGWPIIDVVDRTDEEPWKRSLLTSRLIEALRDPSLTVVCVHNTPGRARLLACRSCRSLITCERCEAAVAQTDDGTLACHRCGIVRPPVCQRCGSGAMANVRPGVTRLREELEVAASRSVVAVTGESDDLPAAGVYVGTEAVLHRVRSADVVAFLDIDAELLAPRYRAAEQAIALLVRAARLVGPRSGGGRIIVQTFSPEHPVIQSALLADPGRLAKVEAARRRDLGLPPFSALARVSGTGADEFVAASGLPAAPDGDGFLVRAPSWDGLGPVLAATPRPKGSRLRIEVDPARR